MYSRLYSRTGTGTDDRNRTRPGTSDQMTGPDQIQMTGPDQDQGPNSRTIRPDNRIQTRPCTDTADVYSNMYSKS